jgi:hypothetical protein
VRGFDAKRVAQTRGGPLVRVMLTNGREYAIFFTLKQAKAWAGELFVISAYALDRPKHQVIATGERKFNVAVALVLAGKKPKFPSREF